MSLSSKQRKRLAIMQPYILPYIGYFHLIEASSAIVFYDDVNYIPRGWINRNRILIEGTAHLFTVPVSRASQNRTISETPLSNTVIWKEKFYRQLKHAYRNAPHFIPAFEVIQKLFERKYNSVADLAISSILAVYDYLGLDVNHTRSSLCAAETQGMEKAERLIAITKKLGFDRYVNATGGIDLYDKGEFASKGVELEFVKSGNITYAQHAERFVPNLSILDAMMWVSRASIVPLLGEFTVD